MSDLVLTELSTEQVTGTGVFDVLMRAMRSHLEEEFKLGRIKGPDYSQVYLGGMNQVLQTSLAFLLQKRKNDLEAQLLQKQIDNAVLEGKVLIAQECKLRAEYDLTVGTITKTGKETDLLTQKIVTEKAQTMAIGVDEDSMIGRQKALFGAQATGFTRDAEQKATKIMVDSWNVRRTTDDGTVADGVNNLNDAAVGRAVTKLLAGVGA